MEILKTSTSEEPISEPIAKVAPIGVTPAELTLAEATIAGVAPIKFIPAEVANTEVATTMTSVPPCNDHNISCRDCFSCIKSLFLIVLQRHLRWLS